MKIHLLCLVPLSMLLSCSGGGGSSTSTPSSTLPPAAVAPQITAHPQNISAVVGSNASFTVAANGTPSPTITWERSTNSGTSWALITGADGNTYSFNAVLAYDGYQYRAIATSNAGTATSNPATLTVTEPPALTPPFITTQPVSRSVTEGQSVSFSVRVTGGTPLTYQWRKGTANIPGATANTYTIWKAAFADASDYSVVVQNGAGDATSESATLAVTPGTPLPAGLPDWIGDVQHRWEPRLGGVVWLPDLGLFKTAVSVLNEYPRPVLLSIKAPVTGFGYRYDQNSWDTTESSYGWYSWTGDDCGVSPDDIFQIAEATGHAEFIFFVPVPRYLVADPHAETALEGSGYIWQTPGFYGGMVQYLFGYAGTRSEMIPIPGKRKRSRHDPLRLPRPVSL